MVKEEKYLFFKVLSAIFLILIINAGVYLYKYGNLQQTGLTGFSINTLKTTVSSTIQMPQIPKILLIVQWSFLGLILFYSFFKDIFLSKKQKEVKGIHIHKNLNKNKTDLDTLYELLKEKKKLKASTISKAFNVEEEIAIEWFRILEAGELAVINYPGFGEPTLELKESEEEIKAKKELAKREKSKEKLTNKDNKKQQNNKKSVNKDNKKQEKKHTKPKKENNKKKEN